MKKLLLTMALALVVTGCSASIEPKDTSMETDKGEVENEMKVVKEDIKVPEGFVAFNEGEDYAFAYPDVYSLKTGTKPDGVLEAYDFANETKYAEWEGAEGYPTIGLFVIDNPLMKSIVDLADEYKAITNYSKENAVGFARTAKGYEAVRYTAEGLYTYGYFLISHNGHLYVFYAADNTDESIQRDDLKEMVDTLQFFEAK